MNDKTLYIVGDGPDKPAFENKYAGFSNISFLGLLPKGRVIRLLKEAQALLLPSIWYEGLPFTVLEAFSTGTPVIASRIGAMAEAIQDGYNGFHFETGNVNDLIRCIQKFSLMKDEWQQLNHQARRTYEEKYHPDNHYKSIMAIYTKAFEDHNHE